MRTLIFVLLGVLVLTFPQFSQTQLLRVGNAAGFGEGWSQSFLNITVDEVTINGKNYFERKLGWASPFSEYRVSYERIEADSAYYVLSGSNTDSLAFNFNWPVGTVTYSYNAGGVIYERRISSIYVGFDLLPQDTIYIINWYMINLSTGDTMSYGDPFYDKYSRKLGLIYSGLGGQLQGAKIDGVKYGDIMPYLEEIFFSEDSVYIPTIGDTGSVKIINTSEVPIKIDSINSVGAFYGYRGLISKPGFEYPFYLIQTLPNPQWNDTIDIVIPPHDSINVSFYEVDLCPICDYEVQEYFKDTLRFVFTFMDGNIYSFSKSIPISGEGYPSDVEGEDVFLDEYILEQNYPNPFNPSTSIKYAISSRQFVALKVFDVLGNEIAVLVNEEKSSGSYEVNFSATGGASKLSSGVYYYQLRAGEYVESKKMIYLK